MALTSLAGKFDPKELGFSPLRTIPKDLERKKKQQRMGDPMFTSDFNGAASPLRPAHFSLIPPFANRRVLSSKP
jgi:hypothetical protein